MKITILMTNGDKHLGVVNDFDFDMLSYNLENVGSEGWIRFGNTIFNRNNIAAIIKQEETK